MGNDNDLNTRNTDSNQRRNVILEELYALRASLTGKKETGNDINPNPETTSISNGRAYTLSNGHSLLPNEKNYFGNWNNGFVNALVLGIIVFLTETLFLLIGYLLFK